MVNNLTDASLSVGPYLAAAAALNKAKVHLQASLVSTLIKCIPSCNDVEPESVDVEHLGGAMTNLIFVARKPNGKDRDVLVRMYGEGTEAFFSRAQETRLFQLLSDKEIGVELLGQFANGRAEKLIHGATYTSKSMRQPEESRAIAKQLRVFHELNVDIDPTPTYMTRIRSVLEVARAKCTDDKFKGVLDLNQLTKDADELEKILSDVASPIVLSHNDMQHGNIMKNEAGQVVLIDFEYTSYNPRGYDIGNHWCEWAYDYHKTVNAHIGEFSKYPTEQEQHNFCRAYLAGKEGDEKSVSIIEVEKLRTEANAYSLATHLYWTIWGYIQATQSEINFDYVGFAQSRYEAFKSRATLNNCLLTMLRSD